MVSRLDGPAMTTAPAQQWGEKECLFAQPTSDNSCHEFSPELFSVSQPPGTDSTTDSDLILQLFLSELGSDFPPLSSIDPIPPSPSLTPSPSVTLSPSRVPSLSSPPSLPPTLAQDTSSSYSPPLPVPETAAQPDFDNPLLAGFADLEGLLNDPTLFDNPTTTTSDVDTMFPFPDSHVPDPIPLDLSECLSLFPHSLSPSSSTDETHTPPTGTIPPLTLSPLTTTTTTTIIEHPVNHDHTYAAPAVRDTRQDASSLSSPATPIKNQRKREHSSLSSTTSTTGDDEPPIIEIIDCDSPSPKRCKEDTVDSNNDKYVVRRQKNNVASQISRSKRRARNRDMFSRVRELEETNARLRERVREMEAEAKQLRKSLVHKLST